MQRLLEVGRIFLLLGLTSFGGPIAHLGYFRQEFVEKRRWLQEKDYADLVALCQFLPGPASSQVGFALGLQRAGLAGGFLAWLTFTLPSALLLFAFAWGSLTFQEVLGIGLIASLKFVAVVVVAHAVWGMSKNLCPDPARASLGLLAALIVLLASPWLGVVTPLVALITGSLLGWRFLPSKQEATSSIAEISYVSKRLAKICLLVFVLLFLGLPLLALSGSALVALMDAFYRAGALVFGGGHVVLPLLEAETVQKGWVGADEFLAGYGVAQAIPGPLFTFAAYLGALIPGTPAGLGALVALVSLFLPGLLLLLAVMPWWNQLRQQPWAQSGLKGANASVVGILGAILYDPLITSSLHGPLELALVLTGLVLMQVWKLPSWALVLLLLAAAPFLG